MKKSTRLIENSFPPPEMSEICLTTPKNKISARRFLIQLQIHCYHMLPDNSLCSEN